MALLTVITLVSVLSLLIATMHLSPLVLNSKTCVTVNCLLPIEESIIWLPSSYPPCIHPGQPLLLFPSNAKCSLPWSLNSTSVSLDHSSRILFAEKRVCFYSEPWYITYSYKCSSTIAQVPQLSHQSAFFVDHKRYAPKRRLKRWLRRRNPAVPRIHFQQERYITEIPENTPINSLVIKLHATHITDEPLYYAMVAPEDSRSANIFTLDTVSGDIR